MKSERQRGSEMKSEGVREGQRDEEIRSRERRMKRERGMKREK